MAKINFSKRELQAMKNIKFLAVKKSATEKIYAQFGAMKKDMMLHPFVIQLEKNFGGKKFGGKISRGENLEGLPFIVLDFPARFENDDILTVRILFWWGNYFSCSLILAGKYFHHFEKNIAENIFLLKKEKIFLLKGEDIWNNNLASKDFLKTKNQPAKLLRKFIDKKNTFKISAKIKLAKHESLQVQTTKFFDLVNKLLFISQNN